MKRKDIITMLMNEGFSQKTLVNLSDKQLRMLAERIVTEQTAPVLNIPSTNQQAVNAAKAKKQSFITYEGEVKEQEKLGATKKETTEKETVIKRLKHKIAQGKKDGKNVDEFEKLLSKLQGHKVETNEEKKQFKSKTEWLISKGIIKPDKKDAKESTDVEDEPEKPEAEKKEKTKKESHKTEGGSEYEKRVAHGNFGGLSLNEWINNAVVKNLPSTTKGEIVKLIEARFQEFDVEEPPVMTGAAEPEVNPDTETETGTETDAPGMPGVDPDDPFRSPKPGIQINPKARKINPEKAKEIIINLLKQIIP